jgi:hypothetical protein
VAERTIPRHELVAQRRRLFDALRTVVDVFQEDHHREPLRASRCRGVCICGLQAKRDAALSEARDVLDECDP